MLTLVRRFLNQAMWLLSHRAIIESVPTGWSTDGSDLALAKDRTVAALGLLSAAWPRWLHRTRPYAARIQVRRIIANAGEWHPESRQVDLDHAYVCAEGRDAADIASILVHEFTHARIDAAGIRYGPATRIRIERACVRQQIAFTTRLPPSEANDRLAARLRSQWERAPELWSAAAAAERFERAGRALGMPDWLIRLGLRFRRWRESHEGTA